MQIVSNRSVYVRSNTHLSHDQDHFPVLDEWSKEDLGAQHGAVLKRKLHIREDLGIGPYARPSCVDGSMTVPVVFAQVVQQST